MLKMKAFFRDIFEYHHHFNQKLADLFVEHREQLSERTIPLFSHCLNAHHIWNSRILGTKPSFAVHQEQALETFKTIDANNYRGSIKIIDTLAFNTIVRYTTSQGETFSNSVADILFHVVNHHTHHKGQLISDLRQQGIEPLITDYIFYKR